MSIWESGWLKRVYGWDYVGMSEGRLLFKRPAGKLGEGEMEYESREILRVYEDWCVKGGVKKDAFGVLWLSEEECTMYYDEVRRRNESSSVANGNKGVASQPEPTVVEGRGYIFERVIEDMRARADMGLKKYGTYLQACNGRDGLRDAYEEVLDLAVYLRQVIDERDERMAGVGELMKKLGV